MFLLGFVLDMNIEIKGKVNCLLEAYTCIFWHRKSDRLIEILFIEFYKVSLCKLVTTFL